MPSEDLDDLPVLPGQLIAGRYSVSGVLGRGGMGVVLSGKHLELGERVAIKFLHRAHASLADRFFREARAAAKIRSEHVVRIYDVGRLATGEPYIVMEYLKGEDLSERLVRRGAMDPQFVAGTLLDVCQALAEAHAAGIIHRDLKPANIYLARGPGGTDVVKLLDFGVAKVPEQGGAITKTSNILGSPVYMSPEQLMASKDVDARSDIWSLGIILFELLTGKLPFEGDSLVHLGIQVHEKPTPKMRALRPELPEGLDDVVGKCLAKDRANRFADVADFADALVPFASAEVAHSTRRIRRVLEEAKRQAQTDLASTIPPPSSEPSSEEQMLLANSAALGKTSKQPTVEARSNSPLAASLAAVSTSSPTPVTQISEQEPVIPKTSGLKVALASGAVVGVIVAIWIVVSATSRSKPIANPTPSTEPTTSSLAATAPPPSASAPPVVAVTAPEPPPAASSVSAPAPSAMAPRIATTASTKRDTHPNHPPTSSSSVAAPAVKPAANCNPPFTIDENGVRRPKPECL